MISGMLSVTGSEEIIRRRIRGVDYVLERRSYAHPLKPDNYVIRDDLGTVGSFTTLDPAIYEFSKIEAEFNTRIAA